jgi:hypothetical protein
LRHILLYGTADWQKFREYAQKRHARWVASGKPFSLKRNWRGSLYVDGPRGREDEE